jgi:hypothetical protein
MPTFTMTKNWDDGTVLTESQLDDIKNSVETFLNTTKLDSDNIQTGGIATAAIADLAVTTAKIDSSAVTTAKIADANVTTAKLADGAVTQAKRESLNLQISSSSGLATVVGTSEADVTNLSVSITTTGRPVRVELIPGGANNGQASILGGPATTGRMSLVLYRGATVIGTWQVVGYGSSQISSTWIGTVDQPSAGTYTYKIRGFMSAAGGIQGDVFYWKLAAYEL